MGGAGEIKRIYNNLQVAYEDFKKDIQGKVILISDTDAELVQYQTKDEFTNLLCYRIVNDNTKRKTILVKVNSNPVSPKTEIEDALNGKIFFETLKEFQPNYAELEDLINAITSPTEDSTYFALDLSPSKQIILDKFFDTGNNKFEFARKYVEKIGIEYKVPSWIEEIKNKLYE